MTIIDLVLVASGLALLVAGAEVLVRGAASAARALGINPLVIGLTVVSFGTSAPELVTGVLAAARAEPDIVIGNVVGSNLFNVLVILGLSAIVTPLKVDRRLIRAEVPIMALLSVAVWTLTWNGTLSRPEGGLLLTGLLVFTVLSVRGARRDDPEPEDPPHGSAAPRPAGRRLARDAVGIVAGLAMLAVGASWLVDGATSMARALGVSELIIGLTLVAVGTSLPELATSVVAAFRGQTDIAVGNVVGSNIFNLLAVLGSSAVVARHGVPVAANALGFDIPVMVLTAAACLPVFLTSAKVERWEGVLFVVVYGGFMAWRLLMPGADPPPLALVVLVFGVPLLGLTWLPLLRRRHS